MPIVWQGEQLLCYPAKQVNEDEENDEQYEADQVEIPVWTPAIETGCPPDAPLCACALKGTAACQDPDGDGLLSLYENCDHVANPRQENCDGDYAGDACDSNNVRITRRTERADTGAVPTGRTTCIYDPDVHSMFFAEIQRTTGTRTIETRQYCGPSGSRTESSVVNEDLDNHSCWSFQYLGCNFTQGGPNPKPVCR